MNKYIVTQKHPFLKQGCLIRKNNSAIIITSSCGYHKLNNEELQKWIEFNYVEPYSSDNDYIIDLSLNSIKKAVCNILRLKDSDFHSKTQIPSSAYSKKLFCYFAKNYSNNTMAEIGNYIRKGYDHSTVHWAHKKITSLIDFNKFVTADVKKIAKELNLSN